MILVSGGMDSATLLHYVSRRLGYCSLYAISFHYGQKHSRELEMAAWQCANLDTVVDHEVVDIAFMGGLLKGATALTDSAIAVPDLESIMADELDQPPTYVPNRNMIMLAIAAAVAESRGCTTVFYGAQSQDEYGYWDCTTEFAERLNSVLSLNRREAVEIQAPFMTMRKADELKQRRR